MTEAATPLDITQVRDRLGRMWGLNRPLTRAELGAAGEQVAVEHLMVRGLRILARNWRCRYGGDEVYIARRSHIIRQMRIAELAEKGLTASEISARLGVTRQTVHNARKSSAIL